MVSGSAAKLLLAYLLNGCKWLDWRAMAQAAGLSKNAYFAARKELEASPILGILESRLLGTVTQIGNGTVAFPTTVNAVPQVGNAGTELGKGENFRPVSSEEVETHSGGEDAPTSGLQPVTDAIRQQWDEAQAKYNRWLQHRADGKVRGW